MGDLTDTEQLINSFLLANSFTCLRYAAWEGDVPAKWKSNILSMSKSEICLRKEALVLQFVVKGHFLHELHCSLLTF